MNIHLTKRENNVRPSTRHTSIFIFVYNVDAVYAELKAKEVAISNPIGNRDYHMRDFNITDPDGYVITFGKGLN